MSPAPALRALPALNANYTPPRPWTCITSEAHTCSGDVVGAVGAYPVCPAGATAEIAAQVVERARLAAWLETPEAIAEARREREWEGRVS